MTRVEALAELEQTRTLTTAMLEPLMIPFEFFLRFARASDATQAAAIEWLLRPR